MADRNTTATTSRGSARQRPPARGDGPPSAPGRSATRSGRVTVGHASAREWGRRCGQREGGWGQEGGGQLVAPLPACGLPSR